ncbi:Trm112 family protein [Streptomyces prasinus]|uniref:Trm112 family protein n=1 Tax=Streptomyces prasinus TaxID=67345 RepID=UPI0033B9E793
MKPDDPLLRILACPLDKGPLHLLPATASAAATATATATAAAAKDGTAAVDGPEESLYNPRLRRRYPIIDGIPQLLPSSGEQVSDEEHETLLARVAENHTTAGDTAGDHMAGDDAGRPGDPGTAA